MPAPSQIPTPQPQNERHEDTSQAPIGKAPGLWDARGVAPGGKGLPRPTETTRESPESTPRPATPPSTPDPSPTPATWDLSDMRQAYMSTPRTETTPAGARTPVGGPPTEKQMLTLMQPQNRHMIPESTPGAQAKLQDDDGRPRLMGYYDTQREYEEGCALNMSQGNLIWITIRKIRPSDITEVLEHLTEQGDHEGNRWVIETTHTAWMGNICISKSAASAWLSIVGVALH